METKEEHSWAVAEQREDGYYLLQRGLSEEEALKEASRLNKVGDYSYVAIPITVTTRRYSLAEFNSLHKRL